MSNDTDLIKLYSGRILALAADIPHLGRLDAPDASVTRRSPLCGSSVTVDVRMKDGQLGCLGQDVKACALGQAAAAVTAEPQSVHLWRPCSWAATSSKAMLKGKGGVPDAPFDGFEVLTPCRQNTKTVMPPSC